MLKAWACYVLVSALAFDFQSRLAINFLQKTINHFVVFHLTRNGISDLLTYDHFTLHYSVFAFTLEFCTSLIDIT